MIERESYDEVSRLMAAWVDDVDELTTQDEARLPPVTTYLRSRGHRPRLPRAASAVLATSAALVCVSGVAAAVTGDPLAVYRPAIQSLFHDDVPRHPAGLAGAPTPTDPSRAQRVVDTSGTDALRAVRAPGAAAVAPTSNPLVESDPTPTAVDDTSAMTVPTAGDESPSASSTVPDALAGDAGPSQTPGSTQTPAPTVIVSPQGDMTSTAGPSGVTPSPSTTASP